MGKSAKSLMVAAIVTIIALAFAYFAGANSVELLGYSAMYVCGWIALLVNWLAFIPAAAAQSDKFYDTTGALTYITVTAVACYAAIGAHGELDMRALAVAAMVAIWCIRLGSFLFMRIHAMGGTDSRFEKIKVNPPRFLVAWTLQALWVILTASAAIAIITSSTQVPIDIWFWVGAAVWVFGFAFEAVADAQKSQFKDDPANSGKFINVGLWKWSRHPNYFGEITLWTGILIIAVPVLSGLSWLVVISPVFVYLLLTRISGVNLQNAQAKERWGDDPAYQEYRKNTPALIPMPPKG
ncbi:DUF1295 domain-containing protein [uncultured Erythrobacter sp.]|uniref:DUF1295 domain-containing protein n=1 Tax=uncultured Erythrobacter sp. TaxID=263913 RepID=UPI0026020127|nr:DUF1295 domain-containing protein [uncultured Erythrobacter sp.]